MSSFVGSGDGVKNYFKILINGQTERCTNGQKMKKNDKKCSFESATLEKVPKIL